MPNKPETRTRNSPTDQKLKEEERCGALAVTSGKPCRQRKGAGTEHPGYGYCAKHGGCTEAGIKSAMREMGRDLAMKFKAERPFGGSRHDADIAIMSPEQALLEEIRRTVAFVRFLEERIGRWNLTPPQEAMLDKFVTASRSHWYGNPALKEEVNKIIESLNREDPDSSDYLPPLMTTDTRTGFTSFTDAREWLFLYREERAHLARISKMAIDAGVAQRLVSIAEDQGRILASAIRAVLTALNLSPEQAALVPKVVPPILRAVATDSPIPQLVLGETNE